MSHFTRNFKWQIILLFSLALLVVFVAGCGGAAGTITNSAAAPANVAKILDQSKNSSSAGGTYVIKTLNITMEVKDTQRVATDLQSWISTTDPLSTAENINYNQVGDNLYDVTLTFSVQASLYPRIESYLNTYPIQHNGRLISTSRASQDVSSDYIDTQSRLKNLRGEQDRLLTLESHAQALGDILAIDQRLTDVEGQIEQIEAHLNQLKGQTSFYTITVTLQPGQGAISQPSTVWSIGAIWQAALGAATGLGQVLITVFIWLLVFSVYIVPVALLVWLAGRWRYVRARRAVPLVAASPLTGNQSETN